jgi:hypothetical protein
MMQSALLQFESTAFTAVPGEDEQTNPGICGKELAHWVGDQLRAQGLQVDDVIAEDFGWCVPVRTNSYRLMVACANVSDKEDHWQVFVFAEGGLLSRLLRKGRMAEALAFVFEPVKQALQSSSSIRGLVEVTA